MPSQNAAVWGGKESSGAETMRHGAAIGGVGQQFRAVGQIHRHSISGTVVLLLGLHGCRFPSLSTLPGPRVLTATLDLEGYGGERESMTL